MAPKSRSVATMRAHVGDDRPTAWQADLATVGVTGEVKLKPRFGGNVSEFSRMNEGNLEALRRHRERSSGGLRIIVVNIIRPGEADLRLPPLDAPGFIDEKLDPDALEGWHHVGTVVVAKNRVDAISSPDLGEEALEVGQDVFEGA